MRTEVHFVARMARGRLRRLARLSTLAVAVALVTAWSQATTFVPFISAAAPLGVVQSFSAALSMTSNRISATPSTATAAGDLLAAVIDVRDTSATATVTGVADSAGNAWTRAVAVKSGKQLDGETWYSANALSIAAGGSVSATATLSASITMTVIEVSGASTAAPLDVMAVRGGTGTAASSGSTPPTITADEVAVADVGWVGTVTTSGQSPGYKPLASAESSVSKEKTGEQAAVLVLGSTGAQAYGATLSSATSWTGTIATFAAPTAPPPPTPTPTPTPTITPTPTASPSPTPSGGPIQHVVVLYQENHSFDNVLGEWCAQTGRCIGLPPTVTLKGGVVVTPTQTPDLVPQMGHAVGDQLAAIDGGAMDGWASVSGCGLNSSPAHACVSGYSPAQVPNITSLAAAFAVEDHTFSMADSPSFGGHLYAAAATLNGFTGNNPLPHAGVTTGPGWGCDSNRDAGWTASPGAALQQVPSCVPDPSLNPATYPYGGAYRATPVGYVPTIMDRLDAAGLPWRLYTSGVTTAGGAGSGGQYTWSICPSFAECLDTGDRMNMVPVTNFATDAQNGTLPAFSIVLPQGSGTLPTSQHNGTSMAAGDNWIGQVASDLENSPEWSSTALFITYDDCGCFYDQVAPGINADGTAQGIRVPMVIVSPYAIAGRTDSAPASFASILRFTEETFGLAPLTANDAGAYDFSGSFNYSQTPLAGIPMTRQPVRAYAPVAADPNDPT